MLRFSVFSSGLRRGWNGEQRNAAGGRICVMPDSMIAFGLTSDDMVQSFVWLWNAQKTHRRAEEPIERASVGDIGDGGLCQTQPEAS